jgi:hypothetical protein
VQLNYLSGGGMAAGARARVGIAAKSRARLPGYDEFSFEPPRDLAKTSTPDESSDESGTGNAKLVADKVPLTTDRNGGRHRHAQGFARSSIASSDLATK